MTAEDFGLLLQMGWCRCGSLIYRPDPNVRCCPQFSMRIRTSEFAPNRKHRKVIRNLAIQPHVRYLGQSLEAALKKLRLIRSGFDYPYPFWFLCNEKGVIRSDVVPTLVSVVCQTSKAHLDKVCNQLQHLIAHQLLRGPNVVLSSLKFDGSGLIFMKVSQYDQCSYCDCGADDLDSWAEYIIWRIRSDDHLLPYWDTIRIDSDVLDKWESTATRPRKLRTVQSSRCTRHDRHRTWAELERQRNRSAAVFSDRVDDNLEISMEPCSFSEEKFQLYLQYQFLVHQDAYDFPTREKFSESMVRSPIHSTERGFGTFHRCYRRKDTRELIAFTLIDVVPGGLNSQYFVWSQQWRQFSLGIFSVLDEIQMIERRRRSHEMIQPYLYIGIYVETCSKMSYKRQFRPSELRTPSGWVPTETALDMVEGVAERRTPWLYSVLERDHIPLEEICDDLLVRLDARILTFRQFGRQAQFSFEQLRELFLFCQYVGDLAPKFVYILS